MARIVEEVLEFTKLRAQEIRALPEAALAACVQTEGFHMTCTIQMLEPVSLLAQPHFPCPRASVVSCKVFYHSGFWIGSISP